MTEFNDTELESKVKQENVKAQMSNFNKPTNPPAFPQPNHPRLDQGPDYERGFIDGMQYQLQTSVDKAVNAMSRTWVGLTRMELIKCGVLPFGMSYELYQAIEAKLKEKNNA
jgi:hypothetical protein